MTIQEIIESINYCLECDSDRIPTTQEDLQTIKEALEKQIPKNPYLIGDGTDAKLIVHCKDCVFARKRYGKLECINGISYRNTYNDPNMFCSYGKTAYEDQSTNLTKNQIDSLSNLNK